jgi:integrase
MSVFKLKSRNLPWRAVVSRKGSKPLIKHFPVRAEAEMWEAEHKKAERLKDVPEFKQAQQLKIFGQCTVAELVQDYIDSNQSIHGTNIIMLEKFRRDPIASKTLLELTRQDANRFVERKLKETWKSPGSKAEPKQLSPRTVRRTLNVIQRVFQQAIETKEGFAGLTNHFRGIRITGSTGGHRDRILEDGELDRILEACKKCLGKNKLYVPLIILLAIETGLRRSEILNLKWSDIDVPNRRIHIRKSKTDKATGNVGGIIVLPIRAYGLLLLIYRKIFMKDFNEDQKIFPLSNRSFTKAWKAVLRRAAIEGLHFHDCRRTANMNFYEAKLTNKERIVMLRHTDKSMQDVYSSRAFMLKKIEEKLDRYVLGGKTLGQAINDGTITLPELGQMISE